MIAVLFLHGFNNGLGIVSQQFLMWMAFIWMGLTLSGQQLVGVQIQRGSSTGMFLTSRNCLNQDKKSSIKLLILPNK